MYRCQICLEVSKPKQQMLRHVVHRDRSINPWTPKGGTEIEREVAVCHGCLRDLWSESLTDLLQAHVFTRVARLEKERQNRAVRKESERRAIRQARMPLFPTVKERRAAEKQERLAAEPAEPSGPVELEAPASSSIFGIPV